jgi:hypothetical protein
MSNQANNQMADIASFRKLDEAYAWLKRQRHRNETSAHRPFWAMSLQWPTIRARLREQLTAANKTWIGRVSKGFDFLGYHISLNGLSMAKRSFDRMSVKFHRLFEQGADQARLVQYLQHWIRWAKIGVSLNVKALILKITEILRNTLHVHVALKSH